MIKFFNFKLPLILFAVLLGFSSNAKLSRTSLKRGIFSKQLTVDATSLGGIARSCLKLAITNTTKDTLTVTVDPALIFTAEDTNYQNLVTWGDEVLVIEPSVTKEVDLVAFCGKSYAKCPRPKMKYKFWRQGDTNMVSTMRYAKKNNISPWVTQSAVWTYTNNHPINTVYDYGHPEESQQMVAYIAKQKKLTMPTQYMQLTTHERAGEAVTREDDLRKIYVPIKWKSMAEVRHMYVTVLKENGDVYKRIINNEHISGDEHTVWVEFNSVNDRKGTYYIELKDNNNKVWDKHKVVIGYGITEEK